MEKIGEAMKKKEVMKKIGAMKRIEIMKKKDITRKTGSKNLIANDRRKNDSKRGDMMIGMRTLEVTQSARRNNASGGKKISIIKEEAGTRVITEDRSGKGKPMSRTVDSKRGHRRTRIERRA